LLIYIIFTIEIIFSIDKNYTALDVSQLIKKSFRFY